MRPGIVASIRVNPKDCMSVVDTIKNTGLYVQGMSYPAMVSMVLSACLESLRQHGTIPTRDGFEYTQVMGPYLAQGRNKKARSITNALTSNSDFQVRPTKGDANPFSTFTPQPTEGIRAAREVGYYHEQEELAQQSKPQKVVGAVAQQFAPGTLVGASLAESEGMTVREAQVELTELCAKQDLAEQQQYVWTAHNQERFDICYKIVYPEG